VDPASASLIDIFLSPWHFNKQKGCIPLKLGKPLTITMASVLKRKRGQATVAEVLEPQSVFPPVSGWDAAFKPPPTQSQELVQTNGSKSSGMYYHYIST